ncbi:PrcB protein [Psychroflexus salinarum]|uniref:PrcB protein n=1 Tax=Psychroflexus salinarum TaxID=546024 RepID=A0ABW3GTH2_9FLAO
MRYISLILLSIIFAGCRSSKNDNPNYKAQDLEVVLDGSFNYQNESLASQRWLISSQSELESKFSLEPNFLGYFQKNPFNFDTHVMLIASDKVRTTGGYSVDIQYDGENENNIFFKVKINVPKGLVTFPVLIPYQVKKFPKTDKTLKFRD